MGRCFNPATRTGLETEPGAALQSIATTRNTATGTRGLATDLQHRIHPERHTGLLNGGDSGNVGTQRSHYKDTAISRKTAAPRQFEQVFCFHVAQRWRRAIEPGRARPAART